MHLHVLKSLFLFSDIAVNVRILTTNLASPIKGLYEESTKTKFVFAKIFLMDEGVSEKDSKHN